MTDNRTGKIYQAIVAIMRSVGAIGKESENTQQNYKYRGAEAVYNRVQPLMATHGVFSVPRVLEEKHETGTTSKGGTMHWSFLRVEYTFYADDGSNIVVVVSGQGMDSGDKSTAKAMTIAHRYAICQLLNIPFAVEDPEQHSPEWSSTLRGGITLRELNEVKKQWIAARGADLNGKTKEAKALAFQEFVHSATGEPFDVADWQQWRREDLESCIAALSPEVSNADSESGGA